MSNSPGIHKTGVGSIRIGTELNQTYIIDSLIGIGGMGEVFKGHNVQTGDPVAIKVVLQEFASDEMILELFRKEAKILNHLSHDAIVRYHVFTMDRSIGRPYLAMEFVGGPSLAERIKSGPLPEEDVHYLQRRLADGLFRAHEAGVIHRDMSPDNVILPGGDVKSSKIIDFGIARSMNVGGATLLGGSFAGKYNYVSPEQLGLYGGDVTPQSDIYSLGLVLAAALRSRPIDMSGSQVEVVEKRRSVPDLTSIPPRFQRLLAAMLQPDPSNRLKSMAEVRDWVLEEPSSILDSNDATVIIHPGMRSPPQKSAPPQSQVRVGVDAPPPAGQDQVKKKLSAPGFLLIAGASVVVIVLGVLGGLVLVDLGKSDGTGKDVAQLGGDKDVPESATPAPIDQETLETKSPEPSLPTTSPDMPEQLPPTTAAPEQAAAWQPEQPETTVPRLQLQKPMEPLPELKPSNEQTSSQAPVATQPSVELKDSKALGRSDVLTQRPAQREGEEQIAALNKDESIDVLATPAQITRFIANYEGGDCFFAWPRDLGSKPIQLSGLGSAVEPFESLMQSLSLKVGSEPNIALQKVTEQQCPAVRALKKLMNVSSDSSLRLAVERSRVSVGDTLKGEVIDAQYRHLDLLFVSEKGETLKLTSLLKGHSFSFQFKRSTTSVIGQSLPQLLVLVASKEALASITPLNAVNPQPADEVFSSLVKEAEGGNDVSLVVQFFIIQS